MKPQARLFLTLALALPAQAQDTNPHPALPKLEIPAALGVNIHFTDARPGELEMLKQGGFRVIRMDFAWGATEKVKGEYNFSDYDRLLKHLEAQKLQPLFILDYSNQFYDEGLSPYSEIGRNAFAKWAAAATTHFKGHNILWEMYNEPNGFWKPQKDTQAYIQLALATGKAIRAATPNECYIGPGVAGMDFEYLEACFEAGLLEYWDAVSVHPYRQSDPETVNSEYRRLRLMIERYKPKGKSIPILSGEWGFSSTWGVGANQDKYLPRQWMTNLMNQVPVSIWYDWHNDGTDPKDAEHNFGTTQNAYFEGRTPVYDPKPSYIAAKTFSQFFDGFHFNKRLALESSDDYLLVFSKGNTVKLAAWTTGKPHDINIPTSPDTIKSVDYLGTPQPDQEATVMGLPLKISDAPLYLEATKPNPIWIEAAIWPTQPLEMLVTAPIVLPAAMSQPKVSLRRDSPPTAIRKTYKVDNFVLAQVTQAVVWNALSFDVEPTTGNSVLVHVHNPNGIADTGQVSVNGAPPQQIQFKDHDREESVKFPMPAPGADGRALVRVNFTTPKDNLQSTFTFLPDKAFAALTPANLSKTLKSYPDGDPAIPSEHTLTLANAPEAAPNGGPVLQLKYKFTPGWKFINIQPGDNGTTKIEGQPKRFGMWVYGDGSGNLIRMRFSDSTGQTFQPGGSALDWKGWRYVTFPLDNKGGHWGGANDNEIHGDLKLESLFLLDSANKQASEGEIYTSSPSWIY